MDFAWSGSSQIRTLLHLHELKNKQLISNKLTFYLARKLQLNIFLLTLITFKICCFNKPIIYMLFYNKPIKYILLYNKLIKYILYY